MPRKPKMSIYRIVLKTSGTGIDPDPDMIGRSIRGVLTKWIDKERGRTALEILSFSSFPLGLGLFVGEGGQIGSYNNRYQGDFISAEIKVSAESINAVVDFTRLLPWFQEGRLCAEVLEENQIHNWSN
jgi:hypothetical protein